MKKNALIRLLKSVLIGMLLLFSLVGHAADSAEALDGLQGEFDGLKQQVSETQNYSRLGSLNESIQTLLSRTDRIRTDFQSALTQVQAQLDVLGAAPESPADAETAEVVDKRKELNQQKTQLQERLQQVETLVTNANNLSQQIVNLRRNTLKSELSLRSFSVLSPNFWSAVLRQHAVDEQKIDVFVTELQTAFHTAWQPQWRVGTAIMLVLALLLASAGRLGLERFAAWFGINKLPKGRLRRSFIATAVAAITVLMLGVAANLLITAFTRHGEASQTITDFGGALLRLCIFCALLVGFGRAFLSNQRPSWRLPEIPDPVAEAMGPFPLIIAILVLIVGSLEMLNEVLEFSVSKTALTSFLISAALVAWALTAIVRVKRVRRRLAAQDTHPARSLPEAVLYGVMVTMVVLVTGSLLTGYLSLARFLSYEFLWGGLLLLGTYLMVHLTADLCRSVFSPDNRSGKYLKAATGISDARLAQIATLLSAFSKIMLVLLAIVSLFNGTFGSTTPAELLNRTIAFMGADGLGKLDIAPLRVFNAVVFAVVAAYLLRASRRWLQDDYLPKTEMEVGMRASILTLYSNLGYALLVLLTLSTLGLQWNNLTWIVSALSVGIGFGLQEIVKNFISGLILLTERPVRVGDLVSISGVEGDICRINVRATEIRLSDRSTVIVPNSQFISQNVRNVTKDNALGVVTIALTFALTVDADQAAALLLQSYGDNENILKAPAPSVTFNKIEPTGLVLSVTGYVNSARMVSKTKSMLLFEILKNLRRHDVVLATA